MATATNNSTPAQNQAGIEHYLLFLLPDDCPHWLRALSNDMALAGYHVDAIADADDLYSIMKTLPPDALIVAQPDVQHPAITTIERGQTPSPIRVLVTDAPSDGLMFDHIDLIVPPHTSTLQQQLRACFRLRDEVIATRQANQGLTDEIARHKLLLQEYEHATDEVNLLKNAIVRNVSHELKTPLLHVKSAVAMLAEDGIDAETLTNYATEAVARLEAVVNNITRLAYSIEINMEPVQISEMIGLATRNIRRSWQHKDAITRVRVDLPDDLPLVRGDKQGLGTVIQLLLDNALKFSDVEVEVSVREVNDEIELSVRDYGIGIAQDQIEKIFESFYQIDNSSTRRYGGTGTGLAIVKLILDRHQAPIVVHSQEGQGSTFTFRLRPADIQNTWD
jgi:signal transduction histidine kinase